ncbi:MAG: hypothetical protein AABZ39_19085 [Spirochaetota bacterium]
MRQIVIVVASIFAFGAALVNPNHTRILHAAEKYGSPFEKDINTLEEFIKEIVFTPNAIELNGMRAVVIPADIALIWTAFDYLEIRADEKDLKKITLPGKQLSLTGGSLRITAWDCIPVLSNGMYSLPLAAAAQLRVTLALTSSGIPRSMERKKMPPSSIGRASVIVTATALRSIEGVSAFDPLVYRRLYSLPHWSPPAAHEACLALGFVPARGTWSIKEGTTLSEDPNRPGFIDIERMKIEIATNDRWGQTTLFKRIQERTPDIPFTLAFHSVPSFMEVTGRKYPGTPANYEAAAQMYAEALAAMKQKAALLPTYIEVKNEPNVPQNWCWHWDTDAWEKLADFHTTVADALHAAIPGIRVGGPCSSSTHFEYNTAWSWGGIKTFFDRTFKSLDFFSFHNYEPEVLSSYDEQFVNGKRFYSQGKLDACYDLKENYLQTTFGEIKPFLVTEYGALGAGALAMIRNFSDLNCWYRLRPQNTYLMRYLERPHRFKQIVPFMFPAHVRDNWSYVMFYNEGGTRDNDGIVSGGVWKKTRHFDWLLLWKDVTGERVPIRSSDPRVLTHAFLDGKTLRVAMNNINNIDTTIDLSCITGGAKISRISRKRMYFADDTMVYVESEPVSALSAIPLRVEETSIVEIVLDRAPKREASIHERYCYGDKVMVPIDAAAAQFQITLPEKSDLVYATVRIGILMSGGTDEDALLTVNGKTFPMPLSYTKGIETLMTSVAIDIPVKVLSEKNDIAVRFKRPIKNGYVSSALVIAGFRHGMK